MLKTGRINQRLTSHIVLCCLLNMNPERSATGQMSQPLLWMPSKTTLQRQSLPAIARRRRRKLRDGKQAGFAVSRA